MKNKLIKAVLLIFIVAYCFILNFVVSFCIVHGYSMENTLQDKDIVIVLRNTDDLQVGQIVVTNSNNPFNQKLVKRVVAISNQTIEIKKGIVYIDGVLLEEDYVKSNMNSRSVDYCFIVPEGHVFLLGDNRDFSKDSRDIGAVPQSEIIGIVVKKLF